VSEKQLLPQRLQDDDFRDRISYKDQITHKNSKEERLLKSRINSALKFRLNKEDSSSELHIKNRANHDSVSPEKKIREENSHDSNGNRVDSKSMDDDLKPMAEKTAFLNESKSHFIRSRHSQWEDIKESLHSQFLSQVDFEEIKGISDLQLNTRLRFSIEEFVDNNMPPEFSHYSEEMKTELIDELIGLGPLDPLCRDKSITEIMVNGPSNIFVEIKGVIEPSEQKFRSEQHLRRIIERIVSKVGRRIDESSPIVNARLADGSRINAVIPPVAIDGSLLTIRRFPEQALTAKDLVKSGSMTQEMVDFIQSAINGALNIIVSGGTGSGKTTFLNVASSFISEKERIVTIEDSAELQLQQRHVVRMETRSANIENKGEIPIRELVKNALRMRPDRLVIGECRSGEAFDMLQAMNTGHDGSLTTLHANSPSDAISRFSALVLMSGVEIPERVIRTQIASAIDLIVQIERLPDGTRKVTHISEIAGVEGDSVKIMDIFRFNGKMDKITGKVTGKHQAINLPSSCSKKLLAHGEDIAMLVSKGVFKTLEK
jgi:pilus assembly protein CpaF